MKTRSRLDDTLFILAIVLVLLLVGCDTRGPDEATNEALCNTYTTQLAGLQMCMATPGCRLNDTEHRAWKVAGMMSTQYCARHMLDVLKEQEAILDKDVQPQPKDERSARKN